MVEHKMRAGSRQCAGRCSVVELRTCRRGGKGQAGRCRRQVGRNVHLCPMAEMAYVNKVVRSGVWGNSGVNEPAHPGPSIAEVVRGRTTGTEQPTQQTGGSKQ